MKVFKRIANIFIDVIVVLVLLVSLMVVSLSLTTESSGVPNIFGIAPLSVQSSSMEGTFSPGDLIFCEVTNDPSITYEKGDVVTFPFEIDGKQTYNTHRIVEVVKDSNVTYYKTQGDNKDTNPVPDKDLKISSQIVAKYTGNKVGGLGNVLSFIRTQLGFFLCVLLPMIIFFLYEAVRVVIHIVAYNKEKAIEEAQNVVNSSELTEEQKQKAIQEYLASIGKENAEKENESLVQTPAEDNNSNE